MKRIFRSKMVTVLAVILIVLLPSCQTTEPVDIADVPAIVLPTLPAAAEAAAPEAGETQPEGEAAVSNPALTLDYLGYTVSVTAAPAVIIRGTSRHIDTASMWGMYFRFLVFMVKYIISPNIAKN